MDSTELLFRKPTTPGGGRKCMKRENLGVVARDGLEPPTPAFSGPLSQHSNMFRIRIIARFQTVKRNWFYD